MNFSEIYPRFPFKLPLLLDGSTGTALMRAGMPAGSSTERWVLENPDQLIEIQKNYRSAGSDAVYAPTFGANRPTLAAAFEGEEMPDVAKMNRELASLSLSAEGRGLVGGDLSPTGLFIEPFGDTPFDEVVAIYREQAEALDQAGVDFFVSETNISLAEARAAVIGVREVSKKPIFVTMTVDGEGRTLSGDSLVCCLLSLAELGISAFGTNCSQGPDGMLPLLRELVPYSLALGIPLIAKPNAGMPHEDEDGSRHFDLDAESFAAIMPEFLESGIPILGCCCGTDSGFIRALREVIDSHSQTLDCSAIVPVSTERTVCTNRELRELQDELPEPIAADESFFDNACMLDGVIVVSLADESEADNFIANSPMLMSPCVLTGDATAIAKAKRYYNGKLLVK